MANATLMMLREHPRTTTCNTEPRHAAHTTDATPNPTPIPATGTAAPPAKPPEPPLLQHRTPSRSPPHHR